MRISLKLILIIALAFTHAGCASTASRPDGPIKAANRESSSDRLRNDLRKVAAQITEQASRESKPRIAVVDFTDIQSNVPLISHLISDILINELFNTGKFVIVERKLLSSVLDQQKLNMTGLVDEGTARKVGKLLGVDYIVTGTLVKVGDALSVNARMISIESGAIEATGATVMDMSALSTLKLSAGDGAPAAQSASAVADLPPADGVFTQWKGSAEFGKEIDAYWKDGYYPAIVEGRNQEGRSEFRAVVRPFPKRVWWFYWWYDQLRSSYEEHRKKLVAEGFREIHLQVFTDRDGMRKYQTCWMKYGS